MREIDGFSAIASDADASSLNRAMRARLTHILAPRSIAYAVCGGFGFFFLGLWCMALSRFDAALASVWIPNACAVAMLILARLRNEVLVFPGLAVGSVTANLLSGNALPEALIFSAANMAEIILVTVLVRRTCDSLPDMHDLAQLGRFLFYGGLLGPFVSSMIAGLALLPAPGAGWSALITWFIADSMGMILIVPVLLLPAQASDNRLFTPSGEFGERLLIMVGGFVCAWLVFYQDVYPLLFLVPPITLLVAFRLGGLGTALYVPGIVVIASEMTLIGYGPIANNHTDEISKIFVLQAFVAANFLTGLPIAAILAGRARLTEELVSGRRELALLTESITDAVLRVDQDGVCTYASPSVTDVLGRAPGDFIGQPILIRSHKDAQGLLEKTLGKLLDGHSEKERVTYRRLLDGIDGQPVFIEADCAAVYDPRSGERDGIVVSARDVTGRIELESELKLARHKAEDAAHAKSEFLANMSHEIRTPMNGVLGFAELLIQSEIDDENRRHAEMIVQSGRSMMLLLNDILDLSKIEAGQISIDMSPIDPVAMIEECLALHRPTAEKKGVRVNFHPPKYGSGSASGGWAATPLPWLVTDGLRLRQIMLNLVGNAVKFTHAGQIDVTCHHKEDVFTVEVKDTGIGISPNRFENIFAPFTQGEADTVRRFGGTGLGLTISRQLAGLLGGEIELASEPGVGSTFKLNLPAAYTEQQADPEVAREPVEPAQIQQGARVLLVEDHDVNRMLGCEMLERCGQSVSIAHDGNEAIAMVMDSVVRDRPYDLVLMDVQMPGCDGYTATRAIRAEGISGDTLPIIALTANAFPEDIAAARKSGMQAHLAKPLVFADLARALQRWLPTRIVDTIDDEDAVERCEEEVESETSSQSAPAPLPAIQVVDTSRGPVRAGVQGHQGVFRRAADMRPPIPATPAPKHSPQLQERWHARRSEAIEAVRKALESGELSNGGAANEAREQLARLVHKLAGTAAIFGEPDLGDQAAVLERALRTDSPGEVRESLAFELLSVADDPADTLSRASG